MRAENPLRQLVQSAEPALALNLREFCRRPAFRPSAIVAGNRERLHLREFGRRPELNHIAPEHRAPVFLFRSH